MRSNKQRSNPPRALLNMPGPEQRQKQLNGQMTRNVHLPSSGASVRMY